MPGSLTLQLSTLYAFLLVLARVAGAFVFVPIPGIKDAPQAARIAGAVAITLALYPTWPSVNPSATSTGRLAGFAVSEAAFGITLGLAVAFLTEALIFAAQAVSTQAGFSYASTVDPTTQADSNVITVFAQLGAGLLFFSLGLDREILKTFAGSLQHSPPGTFQVSSNLAEAMVRIGGESLSVGVRLALPLMALLVLIDVSLALLGRLNAQLQLLSMAFPAKMITALVLMAWMTAVYPRVYAGFAARVWSTLLRLVMHG
jgi:flagellar biosynthetic protein FliR